MCCSCLLLIANWFPSSSQRTGTDILSRQFPWIKNIRFWKVYIKKWNSNSLVYKNVWLSALGLWQVTWRHCFWPIYISVHVNILSICICVSRTLGFRVRIYLRTDAFFLARVCYSGLTVIFKIIFWRIRFCITFLWACVWSWNGRELVFFLQLVVCGRIRTGVFAQVIDIFLVWGWGVRRGTVVTRVSWILIRFHRCLWHNETQRLGNGIQKEMAFTDHWSLRR